MSAAIHLAGSGFAYDIPLDDGMPTIDQGFANWDQVNRVDRPPLTQIGVIDLLKMSVPVFLDGWRTDADQQPLLDKVYSLARTGDGSAPPSFVATGSIPFPGRTWVMEAPDDGEGLRNAAGILVRKALTLKLVEFVSPDVLSFSSTGPAGGSASTAGSDLTTYTTRAGDTLLSIAQNLYGNTQYAKRIGDLNDIRDLRKKLKAGRKLKVPLAQRV